MGHVEEIMKKVCAERQMAADRYKAIAQEGFRPLSIDEAREECRMLDAVVLEGAGLLEDAIGSGDDIRKQKVRACRKDIQKRIEFIERGLALNLGERMADDVNLVLSHISPEEQKRMQGDSGLAIRLIRAEEDFRRLLRAAFGCVDFRADILHARDAADCFAQPEGFPTQGLRDIALRLRDALTRARIPRDMETASQRLDEVRYNFIRLGTAAEGHQPLLLNLLSRAYHRDFSHTSGRFMDYAAHDREAVRLAVSCEGSFKKLVEGLHCLSPEAACMEVLGRKNYVEETILAVLRDEIQDSENDISPSSLDGEMAGRMGFRPDWTGKI